MKIKGFKDWQIFTKIMSISVFTMVCVVLGILFFFLPITEKKIMDEKRDLIKSVVNITNSLLTEYETRIQKGEFSKEEGQNRALATVKNLRYKGEEYLWINDLHPKMIMHPFKPELDGKDLSGFSDPNGKKLFVDMVKVSKENGEGFVDYMWEKPGATKPVPKISFVKLYKPWGWVMGTGIYVDDVHSEMANIRNKVITATVLSSLMLLLVVFFIAHLITRPLKDSVRFADLVAQGNLTSKDLDVKSNDEAGVLAIALNRMKNNLNNLLNTTMGTVTNSSNQVASASEDLSTTVKEMRRRLEEQASRISQVASSSTEMSQTVIEIARNTSGIAANATDTSKVAQEGESVVNEVVSEVQDISNAVSDLSTLIKSLGDRSKEITEVVNVIRDIAENTNLLALNAAIEAARAGEQGRGFAVVADEVRKLAENTAEATKRVGQMIKAIQDEAGKAVSTTEESQHRVERGVDLSKKAGGALHKIVKSVNDLQLVVQQIASATEEMSQTSETISNDIEAIASVSQETNKNAEGIERASNGLAVLSGDLKKVVEQFKV